MKEFGLFVIGVILTVIFAGLTFLFWWKIRHLKDLRTLRLGRLTFFFLGSLWITLNGILGSLIVFYYNQSSLGIWILVFEAGLFFIVPVILGFLIPIAILVLTVKMWRRESKSIANLLLPIIVPIFIVVDIIYLSIGQLPDSWMWLRILSYVYPALSLYLGWQFGVFFLSSWVYGRRVRKMTAPYHVVLGAGLIQGERVGNLLASRIKAAVDAVIADETILVFSGGQGPDEKLPEAVAMQKYAVEELGFPAERTMIEDKSRTTFENLTFSSELVKKSKFLFFTSDYHVFRAALFAAQLGLDAEGGKGGKTAMYYRVPAFIREFIAVLNSQRKKHMILVGLIVGFFVLLAILVTVLYHLNSGH